MIYESPNNKYSLFLYEEYSSDDGYEYYERGEGDWVRFEERLLSRDKTISELSHHFDKIEAERFYDLLPIDNWVKCKSVVSPWNMYNAIQKLLINGRFQLIQFDKQTLNELIQSRDEALSCRYAEEAIEVFPYCNSNPEELRYAIDNYLEEIFIVILQHCSSKWEKQNEATSKIIFGEVFPIPVWLEYYLPLFSGVSKGKFTPRDITNFEHSKDSYIVNIEYCDITYIFTLLKSDFEKFCYYTGSPKKDEIKGFLLQIINRVFNSKGLHYLLSIFLCYDENGRTDEAEEKLNTFFERLNGRGVQIKDDEKEDLLITFFTFSCIAIEVKTGSKYKGRKGTIHKAIRFFTYSGDQFQIYINTLSCDFKDSSKKDSRNFTIKMKIGDFTGRGKFAIIPKKLLKEKNNSSKLKFFTMTELSFQFTRTEHVIISVSDFVQKCGLNSYADTLGRVPNKKQIKKLEDELDYLVKGGYIDEWHAIEKDDEDGDRYDLPTISLNFDGSSYKLKIKNPSELISDGWSDCFYHIRIPGWMRQYIYKDYSSNASSLYLLNPKFPHAMLTGSEIKDFRKTYNKTLKEFAEELNIDNSILSRIENDKYKIDREMNGKICELIKNIKNTEFPQ